MRDDATDYDLTVHAKTDKAILCSQDGNEKEASWLPRSQIRVSGGEPDIDDEVTITVPDWIAEREGWA